MWSYSLVLSKCVIIFLQRQEKDARQPQYSSKSMGKAEQEMQSLESVTAQMQLDPPMSSSSSNMTM